jgi:histidine triad (HIT) family protein
MGGMTAPVRGSGACPAWMASVSKPYVMPSRLVRARVQLVVGCVFCGIVAGSVRSHLVASDEVAVAFLDTRPVFRGHVLVVPREHVNVLAELPVTGLAPYFGFVQRLAVAVEEGLGAGGTFVAMNNRVSQSVPHLHTHVVPRTKGDGLRGFFWPRTKYASDDEADDFAARIAAALPTGPPPSSEAPVT